MLWSFYDSDEIGTNVQQIGVKSTCLATCCINSLPMAPLSSSFLNAPCFPSLALVSIGIHFFPPVNGLEFLLPPYRPRRFSQLAWCWEILCLSSLSIFLWFVPYSLCSALFSLCFPPSLTPSLSTPLPISFHPYLPNSIVLHQFAQWIHINSNIWI